MGEWSLSLPPACSYLGVNSDMIRHQARVRITTALPRPLPPLAMDARISERWFCLLLQTNSPFKKFKSPIGTDLDSSSTSSSTSSTSSTSSSDLAEAVAEVTGDVLSEAEASAMLLTLPKRWDWREHGVVTPVKSQVRLPLRSWRGAAVSCIVLA